MRGFPTIAGVSKDCCEEPFLERLQRRDSVAVILFSRYAYHGVSSFGLRICASFLNVFMRVARSTSTKLGVH